MRSAPRGPIGAVPTVPAYPDHPNAVGMANAAAVIAAATGH
jgi:hypothetical protein